MNTLVFNKLWKYGNVEMCRDRLLMLSMCRNGEKCLDYLVTEFDVTMEMLKYILSVFHPTPVNKSGSVKICILFEKVPFIACVVGSKKGRARPLLKQST